MQLAYKNLAYKLRAVLRYWWAKVYYGRRFRGPKLSMIGYRCGVHISRGGTICCRGRIILNDDTTLQVQGGGELTIGEQFNLNRFSRIVAHERIEIGDYVTIGQMVSILDHDHQYELRDEKLTLDGYTTAAVRIGSHVWIGDKVTILRGVQIGDNVVIAANSVVNANVPAGVVVGGVPARILKKI